MAWYVELNTMNGILFKPVLRHLPRRAVSLYNRVFSSSRKVVVECTL